ncbi:MAG: hypothetical protein R3F21_20650 [Myxococcota bacterium]
MQDHSEGGPSWLFSFLDLALLMLVAMTQLAPDTPPEVPDLGQMVVPRIGEAGSDTLAAESVDVWQLRVHPPEEDALSPYELVRVVDGQALDEGQRIESAALKTQLANLKSANGRKPMLAPHEDSRSQDMLEAAALLEEIWPGPRWATVTRVADRG